MVDPAHMPVLTFLVWYKIKRERSNERFRYQKTIVESEQSKPNFVEHVIELLFWAYAKFVNTLLTDGSERTAHRSNSNFQENFIEGKMKIPRKTLIHGNLVIRPLMTIAQIFTS